MNDRIFAVAHLADQGVLILLVLLSFVSVFMIIERWKILGKAVRASQRHKQNVQSSLLEGDFSKLEAVAKDADSVEGRVTAYALGHMQKHGLNGLEEAFQSFALIEKPKLERSLGFLATVGANAPYIGLFGTVLGIMKAFNDMANAADAGQQAVMSGISSALIATAAGLLVAIPAVLAFNFFQKQVKTVMSSFDTCRETIIAWVKINGGKHGSQKSV